MQFVLWIGISFISCFILFLYSMIQDIFENCKCIWRLINTKLESDCVIKLCKSYNKKRMAFRVCYPFLLLLFNYCVKGLYCFVLRVGNKVAIHFQSYG